MRAREKERLAFGVAAAVAVVVFEVWAGIDLATTRLFQAGDGRFPANDLAIVQAVYVAVPWIGRLLVVVAIAVALLAWRRKLPAAARWQRRAAMTALVLVLGNGVLVNAVLKETWGRPRPDQVRPFGGAAEFVPALHPSTGCERNCSFVTGHAATGFALIAVGALAAPRRRWRWLAIGVAAGLAIGLVRVSQGRHFASDVVFAGLVMWGVSLLLRELWLRVAAWRRRRVRRAAAGPGLPAP
jgi:membrane-associated PAP2 superfamily phosphatase